ncbi:MAG: hypothetical protein V8Q54_11010 [Alistipes senegalensis]
MGPRLRGHLLRQPVPAQRSRFQHPFLLTDREADDVLRRNLQGEAYALRAWFELDLLKKFGGKASDGRYLGFPIVTEPVLGVQGPLLERDTYEKCLKQIVDDCDDAYGYLPLANRNHLAEDASFRVRARGTVSTASRP